MRKRRQEGMSLSLCLARAEGFKTEAVVFFVWSVVLARWGRDVGSQAKGGFVSLEMCVVYVSVCVARL